MKSMDLFIVFCWLASFAVILPVLFLSKENQKAKFLGGILVSFLPLLVNAFSWHLIALVFSVFLFFGVIGAAFYSQPEKKNLLQSLAPELAAFSNFFPKRRKTRLAVEQKAFELLKKNNAKLKKKYAFELLLNAYGNKLGEKKRILKELSGLNA